MSQRNWRSRARTCRTRHCEHSTTPSLLLLQEGLMGSGEWAADTQECRRQTSDRLAGRGHRLTRGLKSRDHETGADDHQPPRAPTLRSHKPTRGAQRRVRRSNASYTKCYGCSDLPTGQSVTNAGSPVAAPHCPVTERRPEGVCLRVLTPLLVNVTGGLRRVLVVIGGHNPEWRPTRS